MRGLIWIQTTICILITMVLLGGTGYNVAAQEVAPYLYYYHPDLNAWVIERADGTDGRLLGQGVANHTNYTKDATWSNSGEWLAWISSYYDGEPSPGNPRLHIISTDGTHSASISEPFRNVVSAQWAAKSDYLFVKEDWDSNTYFLVDVPNGKVIWAKDSHDFKQAVSGSVVGDYFIYWDYDDSDFDRQKDSIKILSLSTGVTMSLPHDASSREAYKQLVDPKLINQPFLFFGISKNQINFLILDIVNGDMLEVDRQDMYGVGQWSSDGQYTLVGPRYICANMSEECVDLWLFSPKHGLMQHIADKIISNTTYWVPHQPIIIFGAEDGSVSIFDVDSGTTKSITGAKGSIPLKWIVSGDTLFFEDQQDMQTFDEVSISDGHLLKQSRLAIADFYWPDEFNPNNLQLSPDGRYVGLGNAQAIYDLEAKSVLNIPPHSGATYGNRKYAYYNWDATSQWLIAGQATSYVDGGGLPRNMILRVDGRNRRELNIGGKPDWLPERVISHLPPAQLESIMPQPYLTLEHPGIVTGAGFNPDGTRLAVVVNIGQMADAKLYIWSFRKPTPQVEQVIPLGAGCYGGETGYSCQINWSRDGRFISLGLALNDDPYDYSKNFSLIDVEKGVWLGRSDYPFEWSENGFSVNSQELSPTRAENATLSAEASSLDSTNDMVLIRQKDTQQIVSKFSIQGKVSRLWWTRDKEHLMVLQPDCSLQEWTVKDGLLGIFTPYSNCSTGWVNYTISPHGHWAATQSIFAPILVYGFGLNKVPINLNWYAQSASFTPDDCWLTASNSWLVTIWKLSDLIPDGTNETDNCKPLVKGTYKVKPS